MNQNGGSWRELLFQLGEENLAKVKQDKFH